MKTGPHCSAVLKKTAKRRKRRTCFGALCHASSCHPKMAFTWLSDTKIKCLLTAVCLIRAIAAVEYLVTSLGPVVAGPIGTPQLRTFRIICKINPSSGKRYAFKSTVRFSAFNTRKALWIGGIREWHLTAPPQQQQLPQHSLCNCEITTVCSAVSLPCRHNNGIAAELQLD